MNQPGGLPIPKDAMFGILICGDDTSQVGIQNNNLGAGGFKFEIKPTAESGAEIVKAENCNLERNAHAVVLANEDILPSDLFFSIEAVNNKKAPITVLRLGSPDPGVHVTSAVSSPSGDFDPLTAELAFVDSVDPGETVTLDFTLDQLSPDLPQTVVEISPCLFVGVGGLSVDLAGEEPAVPLEPPDSSGISAGVVAGIAAGAVAGVVALAGAVWYARRRLR